MDNNKKGHDEFTLAFMNMCIVYIGIAGGMVLLAMFLEDWERREREKVEDINEKK